MTQDIPDGKFVRLLQSYIHMRLKFRAAFPMFGRLPGAWEILLDMALAQQLGEPFKVADAEVASGAPPKEVLMALKYLLDADMIKRGSVNNCTTLLVQESVMQRLESVLC